MSSEEHEIKIPDGLSSEERSAFLKAGMQTTAKKNAFNSQMQDYFFWGATTLLGLAIGAPFFADGTLSSIASGLSVASGLHIGTTGVLAGMGGLSAAALAGSIHYSEKSAEESEQNDLLFSKKQAMDNAIAMRYEHAVEPVVIAVPAAVDAPQMLRTDGQSWVQAARVANRVPTGQAPQWQEQIAARQAQNNSQSDKFLE